MLLPALIACSGVPPVAQGSSGMRPVLSISITVPRGSAAKRGDRRLYVASQTQSIALKITTTGGQTVTTQTFDVTQATNGCTTVSSETTCTESLVIAPGSYLADFVTYDGPNATGNTLGDTQNVPVTVSAGVANELPVTLYGVPASIGIAASSSTVSGSQAAGFTIYGTTNQSFTLTAKDADGNTIVAPGAPDWSVTPVSSGGSLSYTAPPAGSNTLALAIPGNATDSIAATATYADPTVCEQPGANCSATFSVTHAQILFYCAGSDVYRLAPPYTGTPVVVASAACDDTTTWLDRDSIGRVYLLNAGTLRIFDPPYTSVATTLSGFPGANSEFAVDSADDVLACGSNGSLLESQPPYTTIVTALATTCSGYPTVRTYGSAAIFSTTSAVDVADAPYSSVANTFAVSLSGSALRDAIAVSPSGEVAIGVSCAVYASLTAASSARLNCPTSGETQFDDDGNLYIGAPGNTSLYEFEPPFTNGETPKRTLGVAGGIERMRFDGQGDMLIGSEIGISEIPAGDTSATVRVSAGTYVYSMTLTP